MRANFTRADGGRLGLRFEPETFEEQLLLEQFTRDAYQLGYRFEFSGWEHNHQRPLREGLTSCWGQLVQRETMRADEVKDQRTFDSSLKTAVEAASTKIRATLSPEQRGLLARFQEGCRVIGAHEGCASWAVLGCALEAALAAIDLGSALAAVYREQLETYLARADAGYGMAGIEEALRTLLVVTEATAEGEGPGTHSAAIAQDVRFGRSSWAIRDEIIAEVGMMADARTPEMQARYDAALKREGKIDSPTGPVTRQASRAVAVNSTRDERAVRVDLTALVDECRRVIMERPRDGSPPMVAISADVARAIADFARTLSRGIAEAKSPGEAMRWREFAADGPTVGGDGTADALGSIVHPIHVSTIRSRSAVFYGLLRVRAERDGRLVPLSYSVGDEAAFSQATVVNHEYTIAICTLPTRSLEEARSWLKDNLRWFEPLLRGALPDAWLMSDEPKVSTVDPHDAICTWPYDGRAPRKGTLPCNRTDCPYCRPGGTASTGLP